MKDKEAGSGKHGMLDEGDRCGKKKEPKVKRKEKTESCFSELMSHYNQQNKPSVSQLGFLLIQAPFTQQRFCGKHKT